MLTYYIASSVRMFGWVPDKFPEIKKSVKSALQKSGFAISPQSYVSMVCLTAFLGYFSSLLALVTLFYFNFLVLDIFLSILSMIFIPVFVGVMIFIIGIFYPHEKAMTRARSIDTNLPFVIAHMGSIAASGISPSAIFKMLSEFEEYDALSEEMKKIVRNIEVFGLDPMSAMKEVAKRTPSDKFKQLLFGLVSTIEGGGNLKTYLGNAGEQSLFTWRMKREKYLQQLSAYAEFYTGLLIAAPLFIISLFSVMYMIQPQLGGMDILQLMKISIYLLVPALNLGFMLFLQLTQVEI